MIRRVIGILAMLVACASLAVAAVHASPLSGPLSIPTVGSSLAGPDQSPQVTTQRVGPSCVGALSGPATSQPQDDAQDPSESVLSGCVASVDAGQSTFRLSTAAGAVTVIVNSQTAYDDGLSALASLQTGMYVSVDAIRQANGTAIANSVDGPNKAADVTENGDSSSTDANNSDSASNN